MSSDRTIQVGDLTVHTLEGPRVYREAFELTLAERKTIIRACRELVIVCDESLEHSRRPSHWGIMRDMAQKIIGRLNQSA